MLLIYSLLALLAWLFTARPLKQDRLHVVCAGDTILKVKERAVYCVCCNTLPCLVLRVRDCSGILLRSLQKI